MRFLAIIILVLAPTGLAAETKPASHELRFVQLTDAHVFDEGKRDDGVEPYRKALDARAALHWAIDAVNASSTGNNRIDFVAYTGDFGLENVFFSEPACSVVPLRPFKGIPPYSADLASKELAIELNRLNVPIFLVVVGNNDLIDEQVADGGRFGCFVQKLREALRALGSRLDVRTLSPDRAMDFSGFRVTGFNSASFKDASKYAQDCRNSANSSLRTILEQGCPGPQLEALDHLMDSSPSPLIVFTHVPDLVDAFGKKQDPSLTKSSWDLDRNGNDMRLWEKLVSKNSFLALFAGHFHLNDDRIYGTNTGTAHLYTSATAGKKTWVAPPLAGKFQPPGNQVRGILTVRVVEDQGAITLDVKPVWYTTPRNEVDSSQPTDGASKKGCPSMTQLAFFGLTIAVIVVAGLFGGVLNFFRDRLGQGSLDSQNSESQPGGARARLLGNLLWGVAAACLVPLFLHVIGSNLMENMHGKPAEGPDFSQVLIFGGFCLIAAISAQTFVSTVSDRVLKLAKKAESTAEQAQKQASIAMQHLVEPALKEKGAIQQESHLPRPALSADEFSVLHALTATTYALRTIGGLVGATNIAPGTLDGILSALKDRGLVDSTMFAPKGKEKTKYWYITEEGRAAIDRN